MKFLIKGKDMKIIGVIPARYNSSRFPGKPLADINGKPLVWWVYRQAIKVFDFQNVYIATDDLRIKLVCEKLNMPVIMTLEKHPTGTDRVGEVAGKIKADLYVNIQGDEPLLSPGMIKSAITPFFTSSNVAATNLMTKVKRMSDLASATVPKVVCNAAGEAIFLSRLAVPYPKNPGFVSYYKQVCVYGFKRKTLLDFCKYPRGVVESAEDIELLRLIENGIKIRMVEVKGDTVAVDTPSDLKLVRQILLKKERS